MDRKEILEKVELIFRDLLDEDDFVLAEDMSKDSVDGWDSLFHITLMASVADEFDIDISSDDIVNTTDVAGIIDIVEKVL